MVPVLKQLAPSFVGIACGDLNLYFSHEVLIGFTYGGQLFVSENCWGPTTEKHISRLAGKTIRLEREEFETLVAKVIQ